jgi:RNA polymerase sigma-70 factor (ECF subfamily)
VARLSEFTDDALGSLDALYATARRLTRDPSAAEDLVHDTYVKAFRHQGRFRRGTNLRAWLMAILHNTFLNDVRRRKGSPIDADDDAADRQPAPGPTPEESLIARAAAEEVESALASLPEAYREAVWLRDAQEMTYAEIAEILGVPLGTVMSRIARGRRLLHDRLANRTAAPIPEPVQGVKAKGT